MTVPEEYNVIRGFIGLGENILLEILGEIVSVEDMQNTIGTCKATFKLQLHSRFQSIRKNLKVPIIRPPLRDYIIQDVDIVDDVYTNKYYVFASTVLLDPAINSGIVILELLNIKNLEAVGIADESVEYQHHNFPWTNVDRNKIVVYYLYGGIRHIGDYIEGNADFNKGDRVTLELNMDSNPRTLTFFVNDVEQPNYVTNIPPAVRFWV
ncbi:MAG: hypothetical protein EZS28_006873 [Streblomastix strix]|uniref:SPRY domain-containing protein n=1 Tax=Streblomastix strix TaxID=222440 RepID=A0A5J4WST7_9EUKA|nr:MAG: hypothetical protein EZS28_006873 [Streblomastix strix]